VAQLVAVFNIVMNERIVMQNLDRHRRVERTFYRAPLGQRRAQEQLGSQAFAGHCLPGRLVAEMIADHLVYRRRSAMPLERAREMGLYDAN
jgi:hypothetical protein